MTESTQDLETRLRQVGAYYDMHFESDGPHPSWREIPRDIQLHYLAFAEWQLQNVRIPEGFSFHYEDGSGPVPDDAMYGWEPDRTEDDFDLIDPVGPYVHDESHRGVPTHHGGWRKTTSAARAYRAGYAEGVQLFAQAQGGPWRSVGLQELDDLRTTRAGSASDVVPLSVIDEALEGARTRNPSYRAENVDILAMLNSSTITSLSEVSEEGQQIAKGLYEEYTRNSGGLNYQNLPCPEWDELPELVRCHWCAVARLTDRAMSTTYTLGVSRTTVALAGIQTVGVSRFTLGELVDLLEDVAKRLQSHTSGQEIVRQNLNEAYASVCSASASVNVARALIHGTPMDDSYLQAQLKFDKLIGGEGSDA